jgi:hypothetical protein
MGTSFARHGTRSIGLLTTGLPELIDQIPKTLQRREFDLRPIMHHDHRTSCSLEHPARDDDSQFRTVSVLVATFHPHQCCRLAAVASPSQYGHIVVEKRVKSISDLHHPRLAGSL